MMRTLRRNENKTDPKQCVVRQSDPKNIHRQEPMQRQFKKKRKWPHSALGTSQKKAHCIFQYSFSSIFFGLFFHLVLN